MAIDFKREGYRSAGMLSELIRLNTTNPPGNEILGCEYLRGKFLELGLETEVVEPAAGRGCIIGRLRSAAGEGEPLLLLSHLDVVPAEERGWTHPPFSGAVEDGWVWGRGALDCKNATVMEWTALKLFLAAGHRPRRDIILAATADEEAGGNFGVKWLCENRPDLLSAGYCLNEGGGFGALFGGGEVYFCQTAEKGVCWFRLTAEGEAGHASVPRRGSAMERMVEALSALQRLRPAVMVSRTVRELVEGVAEVLGGGEELRSLSNEKMAELLLRSARAPEFQQILEALLHNTLTVTMVHGGTKANVIPSRVEATIDCRVVPGYDPEQLLAELRGVTAAFQVEVDPITMAPATELKAEGELYQTLSEVLQVVRPQARLVPFMVPGGTDGRFLAERGVKVYGFMPMLAEPAGEVSIFKRAHGVDERIAVADLSFGIQVLYETLVRFCGEKEEDRPLGRP